MKKTSSKSTLWQFCDECIGNGLTKIDDPKKIIWKHIRDRIDLDDSYLPKCTDWEQGSKDLLLIVNSRYFCVGYDMICKMDYVNSKLANEIVLVCATANDPNAELIIKKVGDMRVKN